MERALAVSLPTNLDQSLQISSSELQVADTLTYRGIAVEFFQDPMGSQI